MRRFVRRLRAILGVVAIVAIAFVTGVKIYLASPYGSARIVAQLESLYGGRVELSWADVSLFNSTLHSLSLYEAGPNAPDTPWLVVPSVQAEVPFLDLMRGEAKLQQLVLTGAHVVLRFDRAGRLLTRFPVTEGADGPMPNLRLRHGRLTLRQEGRADLTIDGIQAELHSDGERLVLAGSATDSQWGLWTINGDLDRKAGDGSLRVQTPRVHVTPALVAALPFVPPAVGQHVVAEGDTPVDVTLRFNPAREQFHYRIALEPTATRLHVTSIDLTVEQAEGHVVIEDNIVRLRDVKGRTADGTIALSGDLDASTAANRLQLAVAVQGLEWRRLPKSWSLPEQVTGRLSGQGNVHATLNGDRGQVRSCGDGVLRDVRIGGVAADPIPIIVGEGSNELTARVALHDADLARLLRGFDIAPPVAVAGSISVAGQIVIPLDTPRDRRTYRWDATARLPWVQLGELKLASLAAQVHQRNGIVRVDEVSGEASGGREPPEDHFLGGLTPPARLKGTARLELLPPGDLTAQLTLTDIPLSVVAQLTGTASETPTGTLSARGTVRVPVDRLRQLDAWDVAGKLWSESLRLRDWTITDAAATVRLKDAVLALNYVQGDVLGAPLTGEARLTLWPTVAGHVLVRVHDLDAGRLARQTNAVPVGVEGKLSGTARLDIVMAPDRPRQISARCDLEAGRLRVQGVAAERLEGHVSWQDGTWDYRFGAAVLGGRCLVEGSVPPPPLAAEGRLRIEAVRLSRLLGVVGAVPEGLHGGLYLELAFRHDGPERTLAGNGRFIINRLRWRDTELADTMQGDLVLANQAVRLRNLSGSLGGGILIGHGTYNWRTPERSTIRLILENAEAERLLAVWPDLAANIKGAIDVVVRGNLGRHWHGTADVRLSRGSIVGIEMTDGHWPIEFNVTPALGHGRLEMREGQAQVALGRVQGQASLRWGDETRLEGSARFHGVNLRQVARALSDSGQVGGGNLAGRLDFAGSNLRSLDDLTGSLAVSLKQGQVLDLPILRQLAPYIAPRQSLAAFQDGELRARLNRGVVRLERLQLVGAIVQVLMEGTITLAGRLDLEVTANPGLLGGDWPLLRQLGPPGSGPLPIALIGQVSNFLTRRLVHLHIAGTVRDPAIQVVPLARLSEEAARFFLTLSRR